MKTKDDTTCAQEKKKKSNIECVAFLYRIS